MNRPVCQTSRKRNTVLVIVLSETRAYQHTFELFQRHVMEALQADLALCVADNPREDRSNPFYERATYTWTYPEPEDWGEAFDEMQRKRGIPPGVNWRDLLEIKDQWLGGIRGEMEQPGSAGILLFFRLFLKDCLLREKLVERYDRFVVTRSDFIHQVPHVPLKFLPPGRIWIPNGERYGGYTDRHLVVSARDVIPVLSVADRILEDPQGLIQAMAKHDRWNLEQFLKFSFSALGLSERVSFFPYTMYSVRAPDGHTRWAKGTYCAERGYCIKYPKEYQTALAVSRIIGKRWGWNLLTYPIVCVWLPLRMHVNHTVKHGRNVARSIKNRIRTVVNSLKRRNHVA